MRAFDAREGLAQLIVKVSNGARDPQAMQRLRSLIEDRPDIRLIDEPLDRPTLDSLLDSIDCFVSLHRAEGFGLVNAEAMARGKVVVATGWSGNTDFMTAMNSLPVDYRMGVIERDIGPYRAGQRWAEPDVDDAADKLARVAEDTALRRRLGERARADVRALIAPQVVATRIEARLRAIGTRRKLL